MRKLLCTIALVSISTILVQAQWKPLFNGKNLKGWEVKGKDATFEAKTAWWWGPTGEGLTPFWLQKRSIQTLYWSYRYG